MIKYGMGDYYNYYAINNFKEYSEEKKRTVIYKNSKYFVDRATFSKIISDFNKAVCEEVLYENFEYKLPARMGEISIKKYKPKIEFDENGKLKSRTLPVDWKATNELWNNNPEAKEQKKLVRFLNDHTNGFISKWYYVKNYANYKYKSGYVFKASRTNKRELAKILKDEDLKIDYYLR